ncbi:MAG TPA: type IX secretion system sortase PorU, partial [Rhodothermales bacterium]|nr:type IX secretion system sortase PorU [Rhodothermales bacterium]
ARSADEAAAFVEKLRRYEAAASLGSWRTELTVVADDGTPGGERELFLYQSDLVAEAATNVAPVLDVQKVYALAYQSVVTAQGRRIPGAAADARRAIEEGTLIWNYIGHGGPELLADEHLLELADVESLENMDRLPVFVTATCSFGRFDLTAFQSGAEAAVLNPNGGAIAAMTTVRLVYAGGQGFGNLGLNLVLMDEMFQRDNVDGGSGRPRRLGDIYADAKRSSVGAQGNNRKFSLLGDPAMRLGLPERTVGLTSINGVTLPVPEGGEPPAFHALEEATVTGAVLGGDGQPDTGFNGEVDLVVYDSERSVELPPGNAIYTDGSFRIRSELLFRGRASVRDGQFSARFVVPQDVSYSGRAARLIAYARRTDSVLDGAGFTEDALVSTTAGAPLADNTGPRIGLFLNDTTFVGGGLAPREPVLLVRLRDDTGINAVGSGVGHELLLVLDGDEAGARNIGRFYEGDLDDSRGGSVRVPLGELATGPHTARVTAWDVANNTNTAELAFVISDTDALTLRNVYNYPNPTPGPTRFMFEHNQPAGTAARVRLRVYTLSGRPVLTVDGDQALPGGVLTGGLVQIAWDGRDEDLDALATGVYLWHLRVEVDRTDGTREVAERVERLAVIH